MINLFSILKLAYKEILKKNINTMSVKDQIISSDTIDEQCVIPPLLSKSPPTFLENSENNEKSINLFNRVENEEDLYKLSFENIDLNQSSDSKDEINFVKIAPLFGTNKNNMDINRGTDIIDEKNYGYDKSDLYSNPIKSDNNFSAGDLTTTDIFNSHNNDDIENLNWANFDSNSKLFEENNKDIRLIIDTSNNKYKIEENSVILEEKNVQETINTHSNIEEDDDFADFVETSTLQNDAIEPDSSQISSKKINDIEENIQHCKIDLIEYNSSSNISIKYDCLLEKLFQNLNYKTKFNFTNFNNETNNTENSEFTIDNDETWKQLKTYTSVTDASISLKFKWILSNLEKNYLNSLNVERVSKNQVKLVPISLFYNL